MKKILALFISSILLFSSCQNTSTETTTVDTLAIDSVAAATDTTVVEEAVNVPEISREDQPPESIEDFDYTYEGTINNTIKVKVNIFQYNRSMKARAVYLNSKKIIEMDAEYPSVGNFVLTEKIKGKPTGIWKISNAEEDIFTGTWSSPDGSKQMPIQLGMTNEDFDNFLPKEEVKTGFYQYREINRDEETKEEYPSVYSEALYIKNMADNSIYFDLYIQGPPPGVHMGMINGIANKSGQNYVYKNEEGCEINMTFSDNEVTLDQKGTDFNCEFGAGIQAIGTLTKK